MELNIHDDCVTCRMLWKSSSPIIKMAPPSPLLARFEEKRLSYTESSDSTAAIAPPVGATFWVNVVDAISVAVESASRLRAAPASPLETLRLGTTASCPWPPPCPPSRLNMTPPMDMDTSSSSETALATPSPPTPSSRRIPSDIIGSGDGGDKSLPSKVHPMIDAPFTPDETLTAPWVLPRNSTPISVT